VVGGRVDDLWLPLQYDPFSGGGENTELVLTFVKPLRNLETREAIGAIVINMNGNLILQAIERIRLGSTGEFVVMNTDGRIMIASDPSLWNQTISDNPLGEKLMSLRGNEAEFEMALDGVDHYVVT